jgi:DNA mismatch repair ATPase MutS
MESAADYADGPDEDDDCLLMDEEEKKNKRIRFDTAEDNVQPDVQPDAQPDVQSDAQSDAQPDDEMESSIEWSHYCCFNSVKDNNTTSIGYSFYDPATHILTISSIDILDHDPLYFTSVSLMGRLEMPKILLNSRSSHLYIDAFSDATASGSDSIELRPSTEFSYDSAILLLAPVLDGITNDGDADRKYNEQVLKSGQSMVRIKVQSSLGSESNQLSVGCAAVIVRYIRKLALLSSDPAQYRIAAIEYILPESVMYISRTTMMSLDIFKREQHPNMHTRRNDEGQSLFAVLNMTQTPDGSLCLKNLMLQPTTRLETLVARYDTIDFLLRSEHATSVNEIIGLLKWFSVRETATVITAVLGIRPAWSTWLALQNICIYSDKLCSAIEMMEG